MFVDIFIENNFQKIDSLYTYIADSDMNIGVGKRVLVSFGNSYRVGIILKTCKDYKGNYLNKLKKIEKVLDDEPIISDDLIELGLWMKDRYLVGYSKAFAPILPPGNLQKIKKKIEIIKYPSGDDLKKLNSINLNTFYEDLEDNEKNIIAGLRKKNYIKYKYLPITEIKPKMLNFIKISKNIDLKLMEDLTNKQIQVFNYIKDKSQVSRKELMQNLQISYSPIKTLIEKGLIEEFKKEVFRTPQTIRTISNSHRLNEEQQRAYKNILETKKEVSLLYGLTGSGKTEVYLHLVKRVIEQGGDVIVLVPEIGLTPQMIDRFKNRFGNKVAIIHSKLSSGERYDEYRKVHL